MHAEELTLPTERENMIIVTETLRFLYNIIGMTEQHIFLLVIMLLVILAFLLVAVIYKMKRKYKYIITVYIIVCIIKLVPFLNCSTKTIVPEQVSCMSSENITNGMIHTYYDIDAWPFRIQSICKNTSSFAQPSEGDWISENTKETDKYTYIVSYGKVINSIRYNILDGYDCFVSLWNGTVMRPEFECVDDAGKIYIYRINKITIENGL